MTLKDLKKTIDGVKDEVSEVNIDIAVIKEKQLNLDHIKNNITDIKTTLAENTISLKEHMRRTEASESRIEHIENTQHSLIKEMNNTNSEIKEHLSFIKGSVKTISIIVVIITLLIKLGIF